MVKKNLFRYSSVLMCVVLTAASLVGCGAKTAATTGTDTAYVTEMAAGSTEAAITQAITNELAVSNKSTLATNTRQETVYVFNDASGNKNHITVNEKITDANGNETLNKTESSENAPVTMKVTYKLDGKEIKPEDLAGKSGKVTIRFDYTNNQKKTVTINGKKQTVAVPFTMITGMMLPTDVFSNVEVTNGKLTKVGDNIVAVGMTMPGLKDTMNLKFNDKSLDLDIPEYFELTADVKDFSLDMTMSVATSNLLSDMNADDITLDDLKKTVASLDDAATQLADGTVTLQDGTQQLSDAIPALTDGVDQLNTGASSLKDGIYAYADGAASAYEGSVSLNDNMKTYADGIGTLYNTLKDNNLDSSVASAADGASELAAGAVTLDAGIDSALAGAGQLVTGADALSGGLTKLEAGSDQLAAGTNKLKTDLEAGKTKATENYNTAYGSFYKVAFAVTCMSQGINPNSATPQQQAVIAAALAQAGISQTPDVTSKTQYALATGYILKNYASVKQVVAATVSAAAGGQLDEATVSSKADEQIVTMTSGLSQLTANNDTLKSGASQLADGTATLKDSSGTLADGVTQLNEGAITLKDGMAQFNSEAIEPITKLVDSDAQTAVDTIKAVVKAGQEYNSFLGKSDDKAGSVTFVYKTAGITANK